MKRVAFNTANLVARVSGYRFELKNWGQQHQMTVAKTDAAEWKKICEEIAAAGYRAIEIWIAHSDPSIGQQAAIERKKIAADHGLEIVGAAAGPNPPTFKLCEWMGIPAINGGLAGMNLLDIRELVRSTGVRYNFENHPEKSVADIVKMIDGGDGMIGVAVDTGWLGTQGVDAPKAIRELGPLVRHVHVKDVAAPGGHHSTLLGEGCVDVEGVISALKEIGYSGWYSWEDEPEDRNPMDSAIRNREWIEKRL